LERISPKDYNKILEGLELEDISVDSINAYIKKEVSFDKLRINVNAKNVFKNIEKNVILVKSSIELKAIPEGDRRIALKVKAEYSLYFSSLHKFTPEFFDIYSKASLQLNVWPYFRELVNNVTSRMNVPPLTIPLFKSFYIRESQ